MLPNPEAGEPFTWIWWAGLVVLFLLNVTSSSMAVAYSRTVKRKEYTDIKQDERVTKLEIAIREQELAALDLEKLMQEKVFGLQVEMLECQKRQCTVAAQYVTSEMHHGDILRLQHQLETKLDQWTKMLTELHRRLDALLVERERER